MTTMMGLLGLWKYIWRRLLIAVLQLVGVTLAVFFLIRLLPADPVARIVGQLATQESYAQAKASLGLDKPLLTQLVIYLGLLPASEGLGLLQGNLGNSWVTGDPVASELARFFPITLELIAYSFVVALLFAIPIAVISAMRPGGLVSRATFVYGLFAGAQPEFWWGLVFIYFFYVKWQVAPPPLGRLDPLTTPPDRIVGFLTIDSLLAGNVPLFLEAVHHLLLPVGTLAFVISGPIIKMVRKNMMNVLQSDFVLYARMCGLAERRIALYTLRNALTSSMTLVGVLFAYMIGGAVLVEQVFSWGGLGQYAVRSILNFDYPAIMGVVMLISAFSLLVYLILDILYVVVDPRIVY